MNATEIMRALHMTAMGRINTPEQQKLCEKLADLMADMEIVSVQAAPADPTHSHAAAILSIEAASKRTRKAKAD